jgi:hypothetical protein
MSKSRKMFLSEEETFDRRNQKNKQEKNLPHVCKLPPKVCSFCGADENKSVLILDGSAWYCAFQKQCDARVDTINGWDHHS